MGDPTLQFSAVWRFGDNDHILQQHAGSMATRRDDIEFDAEARGYLLPFCNSSREMIPVLACYQSKQYVKHVVVFFRHGYNDG